ncbi:hypothetical protein B0T24DRAFT_571874 [Lasiosphaeria ovina]|uniref:Protein kinase domain-containing protein n=1 Tax=Lasiosphaeria ovina TaxID=92902 RepID=A0AAE0KGX3_9PEZI|nr:hypothetical protein B0T24DRAFT_571874 [Lasiosphaeria ovina]
MGFFENCKPDDRFYAFLGGGSETRGYFYRNVQDWDERRTVTVETRDYHEIKWHIEALAKLTKEHQLRPDTIWIKVAKNGALESQSNDIDKDQTIIPLYPSASKFLESVRRIGRWQLAELDRLGKQTDLTSYKLASGSGRSTACDVRVVFKYYTNEGNAGVMWDEIHCVMMIPRHPNIITFDHLVTDVVDKKEIVVGFTTLYVGGGTLDTLPATGRRRFTLAHLKQLLEAIDWLNRTHGILHNDLFARNLLIDPDTDQLKIFDFNLARRLDEEERDADGDYEYDPFDRDTTCAAICAYQVVTQDLQTHADDDMIADIGVNNVLALKWEKHHAVTLDEDVAKYKELLSKWASGRADAPATVKRVPQQLVWQAMPKSDHLAVRTRSALARNSEAHIDWQRPSSSAARSLAQGEILLATGEVLLPDGRRRLVNGTILPPRRSSGGR